MFCAGFLAFILLAFNAIFGHFRHLIPYLVILCQFLTSGIAKNILCWQKKTSRTHVCLSPTPPPKQITSLPYSHEAEGEPPHHVGHYEGGGERHPQVAVHLSPAPRAEGVVQEGGHARHLTQHSLLGRVGQLHLQVPGRREPSPGGIVLESFLCKGSFFCF